MTDVNHQVSKALVVRCGAQTLFVVEDLTGIRGAAERVHRRDRYPSGSGAFYQFRHSLVYKAAWHQARTMAADPRYTSHICPKYGQVCEIIVISADTASRVTNAITDRTRTGLAP